jgi:NAD(P)-dependent dehydrogenase (short-subunit alcohol dehydrogenase family)
MGKGALILGASGGIGTALATRLRNSEWDLVLAGRNEKSLSELASTIDAPYFVVEATDLNQVQELCRFTSEHLKDFNGAVNCVGSILLKPAHLTSEDEFTSVLKQNLYTSFFLAKSVIPFFKERGGSIVMFSTAAAQIGIPNHEAIAAAKLGIEGFVRAASATYATNGIRLNTISPGLVNTPLARKITNNQKSLEFSLAMHPLGRIGEANDIASAAAWLLEPENSWITGQNIVVDGGLSGLKTH